MKSNISVCPRPFIILLLLSSLMYVWVLKPHNLGKNKEIFLYLYYFFLQLQVSHRVVFPLELRLFNTSDDAVNPDRMYDLVAVVIHCGSGPNR